MLPLMRYRIGVANPFRAAGTRVPIGRVDLGGAESDDRGITKRRRVAGEEDILQRWDGRQASWLRIGWRVGRAEMRRVLTDRRRVWPSRAEHSDVRQSRSQI
jgi:hypothetical protein